MLISGDAIETLRPVCRLANDGEEAEYSRQVFNPQAIRILAKRRKGCNTCHVRKIKCDLREPTCYNCERSRRYICDGYKASVPDELLKGGSRQSQWPLPDFSDDAPATLFDDGLSGSLPSAGGQSGQDPDCRVQGHMQFIDPFSGFQTPFTWPDWEAGSGLVDDDDEGLSFLIASPGDILSETQWQVHMPEVQRQRQGQATTPVDQSPRQRRKTWMAMSPQGSCIEPDALMPEKMLNAISSPDLGGLELSSEDHQLLHHYRTHVSAIMMPTLAPTMNPYLQVYLPLAIQARDSPAQQALLHAILAVAALNKAQLTADHRPLYRNQAREHRDQAFRRVSKIVSTKQMATQPMDESDGSKHALLAAAITLTTIEVFSGADEGKGYEILHLCKLVIGLTGGQRWWLANPASMTLLQNFQCLHIVGCTSGRLEAPGQGDDEVDANPDRSPASAAEEVMEPPLIGHELLQAPHTYMPQYTLDVSFGISIKTLSYLHRTIMLSKVKASLAPGQDWPPSAREALVNLEQDIFTDMEDAHLEAASSPQALPSEGFSQYVAQEIQNNHMLAFHYSTAIFFRRALCDGTAQIVPPLHGHVVQGVHPRPTGKYLVSKALEHLENIDALAGDLAIANTLWPGFIAAAEAVDWGLRRRALMWFGRAKRHGIGNIAKAKDLVQDIWRRVDSLMVDDHERHAELGPVDWRKVMHSRESYIMLT